MATRIRGSDAIPRSSFLIPRSPFLIAFEAVAAAAYLRNANAQLQNAQATRFSVSVACASNGQQRPTGIRQALRLRDDRAVEEGQDAAKGTVANYVFNLQPQAETGECDHRFLLRTHCVIIGDIAYHPPYCRSYQKGASVMLTLWGSKPSSLCDGMSRRNFLKIGAFGAGLTLADMLRLKAAGVAAPTPRPAKAAIMIWPRRGPEGPPVHRRAGAQHHLPGDRHRSRPDVPQRQRPADVHPRRPRTGPRVAVRRPAANNLPGGTGVSPV